MSSGECVVDCRYRLRTLWRTWFPSASPGVVAAPAGRALRGGRTILTRTLHLKMIMLASEVDCGDSYTKGELVLVWLPSAIGFALAI